MKELIGKYNQDIELLKEMLVSEPNLSKNEKSKINREIEVLEKVIVDMDSIQNQSQGIDLKYMGIPNICFSLTKPDDEREIKYIKQRIERGFDDTETWSLRHTIGNFIIPRLERYEEIANDFLERDPELIKGIEDFLCAMKLITRDNGIMILSDEENKLMLKGLKAFPDIFLSLWW